MSETITGNAIQLVNGKTINIRPVDARTLALDVSSVAFLKTEKDIDNNIISICFEDKYSVELGTEINVQIGRINSVYEVNYILISKKEDTVLLFSTIPTKTSTFLLPLLGKTKKTLKFNSYFVNAFLDSKFEHLCLLYRFTGTQLYNEFEAIIMKDTLCITHKEYDPYHVIYIFKIPNIFLSDIEYFKDGKFSKFSDRLKRRIWSFYGKEDGSAIMHVINRSKELKEQLEKLLGTKLSKDAELASKPNMSKEIYNIKENTHNG